MLRVLLHRRVSRAAQVAAVALSFLFIFAIVALARDAPALARAWLRPQDRLIACEVEPQAIAALRSNLRGDVRIKTVAIDGWTAFGAYVPPKECRGLVLVDLPFERDSDFFRLAGGLSVAHHKWATGIYALWYPIKDRGEPDALAKKLRRLGIAKILQAKLSVAPLSDPTRLNGCGLFWSTRRVRWNASFPFCCRRWRRSWGRTASAVSGSIGLAARGRRPANDIVAPFLKPLVGV